jgi:RecA-family ATPase
MSAPPPKPVSVRELRAMTFTNGDYLIDEGILNPNSLMFIGGPPKAYKSFILASLLYHLVTGTPLFGNYRVNPLSHGMDMAFKVSRPMRVLLLEQEVGFHDMQQRLQTIYDHLNPYDRAKVDDNFFLHSCDHTLEFNSVGGQQRIQQAISSCKPDVVAFDPLVEFHTGDENSAKDMMTVFRNLDFIRERNNVAVIITHHTSKPSFDGTMTRSGPDLLRGSSTIFAKGDTYFIVTPTARDTGGVMVEVVLRRGKPILPFRLRVDFHDLRAKFNGWGDQKPEDSPGKSTVQ